MAQAELPGDAVLVGDPRLLRRLAAHLRTDRPAADTARDIVVTAIEATGADEATLFRVVDGMVQPGELAEWPAAPVRALARRSEDRVDAVRRAARTDRP